MLNSDQDLDINPTHQVAGSRRHSLDAGASLQYSQIVTELSMEQSRVMQIFTEATAQAVRLTDAPIAILTAIGTSGYQIGSISGLEKFGHLPSQPNLRLELAGLEYCHDRAISSDSGFSISNFQKHPQLAQSSLYRVHGIQAYLGVPTISAAGDRLGAIAILDFHPREFSERDTNVLQLVSRLVASEFERQLLSQSQLSRWIGDLRYQTPLGFDDPVAATEHISAKGKPPAEIDNTLPHHDLIPTTVQDCSAIDPHLQAEIQFKLLTHLAQELRTPLTAILGMASVLQQEIYGALTSKQKDYVGIIHHSGQQLVTIVDEISQLGGFVGLDAHPEHLQYQLTLKPVELEMLCQLALQSLEPLAHKKQQQISLNFAEGSFAPKRICWLDKDRVRQIIYYLCLSLIHASDLDRQISIQLSNLTDLLQIQIATNDPQAILSQGYRPDPIDSSVPSSIPPDSNYAIETKIGQDLHISLGLSLSHTLAASHGGKIEVIANGRGYQLTLPLATGVDETSPRQH